MPCLYVHARRFGSVEKASAFKEAVDEAERVNTEIMEKQEAAGEAAQGEPEGTKDEEKAEAKEAEEKTEAKEAEAKEADALAEKLESTAKVAE